MVHPNPKVKAAFAAMKALGIDEVKVKPVLKKLLKAYDKNWEPIEEENYRVLLDAIFEDGDDKVADQKRKSHSEDEDEEVQTEELQRPSKRLRERNQENQSNAAPETLMKRISSTGNEKIGGDNGEVPASSHLNGESRGAGHPVSQMEKHNLCQPADVPVKSINDLEIASSSLGEVKMVMNCNSTIGRSVFHMPNLDVVIKMMEEKCQQSYRILDPSFSVKKLLSDMCQCVLELGRVSHDQPDKTVDMEPNKSTQGIEETIINETTQATENNELALVLTEGAEPQCFIFPDHQLTPLQHHLLDIADGHERATISWVNEIDNRVPPSFIYTPENLVFDGASVRFSLAQIDDGNCCPACTGDCLSSTAPCPCTLANGGEFAYTVRGLIKESFLEKCVAMTRDPTRLSHFYCQDCPLVRSKGGALQACPGHLKRNFIKECWKRCHCNRRCGNRVVQRGIRCSLQVFMTTEGKGWGLRTMQDLPKGAFVCEYIGEILTNKEVQQRITNTIEDGKNTYQVVLDSGWDTTSVKDDEALCLDTTCYANVARFINHRCNDANLIEIPVEVESPKRHYYHLAFFTTRNVQALEELTWDYGIDFNGGDQSSVIFECRCGSETCRNRTSSSGGAIVEA